MRQVKIFGERNTATNLLRRIIESNSSTKVAPSEVRDLAPMFRYRQALRRRLRPAACPEVSAEAARDDVFRGRPPLHSWKHRVTDFSDVEGFREVPVLFTIRHPVSWCLALHRRPYHVPNELPRDLADFISVEWKTVWREGLGCAAFRPLELWATKLRSYGCFARRLEAQGTAFLFIRFEDLVTDQESVFRRISDLLDRPARDFQPLVASTKDAGWNYERYRDYYGNERWRSEMTAEAKRKAEDSIDTELAGRFGYGCG